jgi:signal transduction histidine kinase
MSTALEIRELAGKRDERLNLRAAELFKQQHDRLARWMDRSMAALFIVQWALEIVLAIWVAPRTWAGLDGSIDPHIWVTVAIGGAVISVPLLLVLYRPGKRSTRLAIAVAQGLSTAVLIHLSGGRMEAHFYVFVSLPLLAFYRDWTVLAAMSAVVACDQFVRGTWWPQSVYGVGSASPLRFLEYTSWLVMEDLYLWLLCRQGLRETWSIAERQARLEVTADEMTAINEQLRDEVVERRRAQQALERAKNAAEAASRAKTEFLANMSHELRTPLNSVIGFSDVLSEQVFGPLNDEQAQYVTDILDSGQHLLSLVNDILDLAKIEAGSMELARGPVVMSRLVERTIQMFRERAIRLGIRLVGQVGEEVGQVEADERRLKQLLYNLLSNALKFTPEGGEVRIEVRRREGGVELRVSDTGVGIAADQLEKIFESFYQVDSTLSKNAQGTGLGLAVVRQIAELHGGTARACSTEGEGSTFIVELPDVAADTTGPSVEPPCEATAVSN